MTVLAMRFPIPVFELRVSSFGAHIPQIISLGAKEEMAGIDALGIIAGMANAESGRDRPVSSNPCSLVGHQLFTVQLERAALAF